MPRATLNSVVFLFLSSGVCVPWTGLRLHFLYTNCFSASIQLYGSKAFCLCMHVQSFLLDAFRPVCRSRWSGGTAAPAFDKHMADALDMQTEQLFYGVFTPLQTRVPTGSEKSAISKSVFNT